MGTDLTAWLEATGAQGKAENYTKTDLEGWIMALFEQNVVYGAGKTKSQRRHTFREIWDIANGQGDAIAGAFSKAIEKRAGVNYVRGCLSHQDNGDSTDHERPTYVPSTAPPPPPEESAEDPRDENNSYIRLWRSIRHHPWLKGKPYWVRLLFIDLCLDAAWKDHDVEYHGKKFPLKRGQWIVSERDLARQYDQSQRMVHFWLDKLEKEQMIQCVTVFRRLTDNLLCVVSGHVSGNVSGHVSSGTLVTICKYDSYQSKVLCLVSGRVSGRVSGTVSLTEEGITKEGEPEEGIHSPQTPLTNKSIVELWNQNRGLLMEVTSHIGDPSKLDCYKPLVELFTGMAAGNGSPAETKWVDFVKHLASTTHSEHHGWMSPEWLAKDLKRVDQAIAGQYARPFGRSYGKSGADEELSRIRRGGSARGSGKAGAADKGGKITGGNLTRA